MLRTMKNFSDITAIETVNALNVNLQYRVHGRCAFSISVNDYYFQAGAGVGFGNVHMDLFDSITLKVELMDFDEGTSGVEIKQFSINGLEILPKYQHLSSNKKCYIDELGTWYFEIPSAFYTWYHQITGHGWIA